MDYLHNSPELMKNLTNLGEFLFAIICINLVPGADFLLLVKTTITSGLRESIKTLLGVCASTTAWNLMAVVGLSALFAKSPQGVLVLKGVGGVYLLYLGISSIYSSFKKNGVTETEKAEEGKGSNIIRSAFLSGFVTDFLNPDTGLFTLSFFPKFIEPGYSTQSYLLLLTVIQAIGILGTFGIIIYLASKGAEVLTNRKVSTALDWVSGALFIYFGIILLMTFNG